MPRWPEETLSGSFCLRLQQRDCPSQLPNIITSFNNTVTTNTSTS